MNRTKAKEIATAKRRARSKDKSKNDNRNKGYGVRKNSLSRSLTDISNTVPVDPSPAVRRSSVCYVTPDIKSPCPEIIVTEESVNPEAEISARYKFIKAVKEVITTRVQSADSRREYAKMKTEMETTANIGRREIIIVEEGRISPMPKLQSEPTILSFPFAAEDNSDKVDGQPCQHEACMQALVTPRNKTGARLCMLAAVAHMKMLAAKRPKNKQELKRNPITTADEKLLLEKKESEEAEHAHSDSDTEVDPMAYLRGCRYLRGVEDERELSVEEIFH